MTPAEPVVCGPTASDRTRWLEAWEATGREPFAHPAYMDLFLNDGESGRALIATSDDGTALLPFVLRMVPPYPGFRSGLRDATSPYGYGGPFGSQEAAALTWPSLVRWMKDHDVVTFFGRLSLDFTAPGPSASGVATLSPAENVVVDLTRAAEDQWQHYEHKVRKNVNKARRAGLSATVTPTFTDTLEFAEVYGDTMERRGADEFYRFDAEFFTRLAASLFGSYAVAEVRDSTGALVSAELVLRSDRRLYSFLGGTRSEALASGANDLLKHAVIDYGRDAGLATYVLGGGYRAGDGIFRYKRSFDRDGVVPFRVVRIVADQETYSTLVDAAQRPRHAIPADGGYFPAYRAPLGSGLPHAGAAQPSVS